MQNPVSPAFLSIINYDTNKSAVTVEEKYKHLKSVSKVVSDIITMIYTINVQDPHADEKLPFTGKEGHINSRISNR